MNDEPLIFDAVGVNADIAGGDPAIVAADKAGRILVLSLSSSVAMRMAKDVLRVLPRAERPDAPSGAASAIDFSDMPQCQEIGIGLSPEMNAVVVHLRFGGEWLSLPMHGQVLQTLASQLAQAASILASAPRTKQ
ncbi:MAG TPA: hypothetical protein VK196_08710 [Magnetospirillum sp.]|nr:hypothetical protein [Magnetospirillum sp.]